MPIIYPGSIERTAFAEKMDDKGFVELDCSHNGVEKINFIKLPARPMYDINIDQADSIGSLNSLVAAAISDFDKEAVIRIKLGPEIGEKIKKQVTSAFLRGIFPQTMNVQLSGDFGSNIKKYAGSRNHNQSIVARIRKEAPNSAGVYLFKGDNQIVIYVGKSVNLKQRMASYFYENSKPVETRIQQMVFSIRDFAFIETGTELLALILEDQLIKKHLPAYNIKQKEFKEYRYLLLTNDTFPTLKIITHDDAPNRAGDIFGPFKDEYFVRDLLDIIYRRLNLRQCQEHEPVQRSINYELGLCTGPCRGKIGAQDYAVIAQRVSDFLNGDEKHLFEILSRAMGDFAASLEYEKAADVKREIEFCQKFCKRQRFLHQFKTSKLTIEKNSGATERYTLMKGVLSSAKFNGADIPPLGFDTYTTEHSDARYILDRANIVYNWLNRSTDIVCTWH